MKKRTAQDPMPRQFVSGVVVSGSRLMAVAAGERGSRFNFARGEGIDPMDPAQGDRIEDLLKAVEKGEVRALDFEATVTTTDVSRNFGQFEAAGFEAFAKTFKGQPFLRDHGGGGLFGMPTTEARGGTIVDSWTEEKDGGGKAMKQQISLTKAWAMKDLLEKTMDRFSVGWSAEEVLCSVCNADFRKEGFFHKHIPGEYYDSKGERVTRESAAAQLCVMLMKGCSGNETSTVVIPAYEGTGISALSLTASGMQLIPLETLTSNEDSSSVTHVEPEKRKDGGPAMIEKLRAIFGLKADADEASVIAAAEKAAADGTTLGKVATAAGMPENYQASDLLATCMDKASGREATELRAQMSELKVTAAVDKAIATGKYTPAERDEAMKLARLDLTAFEAHVARKAPVVQIGRTAPTETETAAGATTAGQKAKDEAEFPGLKYEAGDAELEETERKYLRSAGSYVKPDVFMRIRREEFQAKRAAGIR